MITAVHPNVWSDETCITDTEGTRRHDCVETETLPVYFQTYPNEPGEQVYIKWDFVKGVSVHAEAFIKVLESLGYEVKKPCPR